MYYLIRATSKDKRDPDRFGWCCRHAKWYVYSKKEGATRIDSLKKALRVLKTSRGLENYRRWNTYQIIEVHPDGFEHKVWPIKTLGEALKSLANCV